MHEETANAICSVLSELKFGTIDFAKALGEITQIFIQENNLNGIGPWYDDDGEFRQKGLKVDALINNSDVQTYLDAADDLKLPAKVVKGGPPDKTTIRVTYANAKDLIYLGIAFRGRAQYSDTVY